ncbi:MAG: DUF445 domain-containing protein [Selenomonadaceae bacterium]|nr:DUF445 domain-containing protein [Selenomonadaceae bacterium]
MWSGWNKADKTLLFAAAVFLLSLCLHLSYPDRVVADGFLFISEAALVGGIADWFAVTALFRKPLGFPYHTAILPNRRKEFVQASVTMVQKEFFSRRKIFRHLGRLHLMPMLMEWLDQRETREQMLRRLLHYTRDLLLQQDRGQQAKFLSEQLRHALRETPATSMLQACGAWMKASGRDKDILERLAAAAHTYAERPEIRKSLQSMLEAYEEEKVKSPMAMLMAGFAQALDLVNFEEAAALMQQQLLAMIDALGTRDSELQSEILQLFYEKTEELGKSQEFQRLAGDLRDALVEELPLEEAVSRALEHVQADFLGTKGAEKAMENLPVVRSRLLEVFASEYYRALRLLQEDETLRKSVEHFLYDLLARSALHAQSLVGVVVTNVLDRLTDEQLNHLVYDKVEPDLLWIRMNGSIVGSAIGFVLFLCLQMV